MILVPQRPAMPQSTSPTKPAPISGKSSNPVKPSLSPIWGPAHPQRSAPLFQGAFLSRPISDPSGETSLGFLERLTKRHLGRIASLFNGLQRTLMIKLGVQPALQNPQEPEIPDIIHPDPPNTEPPLTEGPDSIDLATLAKPIPPATPPVSNPSETRTAAEGEYAERPHRYRQEASPPASSANTRTTSEEQPDIIEDGKPFIPLTEEPQEPGALHPAVISPPARSPELLNLRFEEEENEDSTHPSLSSSLASSIELVERPVSPRFKNAHDLEAGWALVDDTPHLKTETSHLSQTYPPQKSRHIKPHKLPLSQRFNQFILKRGDLAKL